MKSLLSIMLGIFMLMTAAESYSQPENKTTIEQNIIRSNESLVQNNNEIYSYMKSEFSKIRFELNTVHSSMNDKIDTVWRSNVFMETYKPLFQEMQKQAEFLFGFAKYLFLIFTGLITISGFGLGFWLKKVEAKLKEYEQLSKKLNTATKQLGDNSSKYFDEQALSKFKIWQGKDEKYDSDKLLSDAINYGNEAIKAYVGTFGDNLERMNKQEQTRLITYYQNYANYIAQANDHQDKIKEASKYAHFAFEYGASNDKLGTNLEWIKTYFYVLAKLNQPDLQKEWIERYELWSQRLIKSKLNHPVILQYYEKIKNF